MSRRAPTGWPSETSRLTALGRAAAPTRPAAGVAPPPQLGAIQRIHAVTPTGWASTSSVTAARRAAGLG